MHFLDRNQKADLYACKILTSSKTVILSPEVTTKEQQRKIKNV